MNKPGDTDLPQKLEAEFSGILAWIVEGALNYYRDGLRHCPPEVRASTDDYRESSNRLKEFIQDCCRINPCAWVSSERIVGAYEDWCRRKGEKYPVQGRDFTDQLRSKGCAPKSKEIHGKQTRGWVGIGLMESARSQEFGRDAAHQ